MPDLKRWKIAGAREVKPEKPGVETLDHVYVGYTLAKIFAGILAGYLVLALVSITYSESRTMGKMDVLTQGLTIDQIRTSPDQTNAITKEDVDALTKSVAEAYRETRAATIEFHKTVIINVLFPILTALLGYIFANRGKNFTDKNGK